MAAAPAAAQGFDFDPDLTQEQFHIFSSLVSQAIYPSPVNPPDPGGLFGFDIGIAATAIPIDEEAAYWVNSVDEDILYQGYLAVPRLVASKGLGFLNLSASYAEIPDTDIKVLGGSFDVPILNGGVIMPTLVVRGAYATIDGIDDLEMTTYGGEVVLGKTFGPITPYIGGGIAFVDSRAVITGTPIILEEDFDQQRITGGVRFSLVLIKVVAEAIRTEEDTSYGAKLSLGW